jgi:hypothetical protein
LNGTRLAKVFSRVSIRAMGGAEACSSLASTDRKRRSRETHYIDRTRKVCPPARALSPYGAYPYSKASLPPSPRHSSSTIPTRTVPSSPSPSSPHAPGLSPSRRQRSSKQQRPGRWEWWWACRHGRTCDVCDGRGGKGLLGRQPLSVRPLCAFWKGERLGRRV